MTKRLSEPLTRRPRAKDRERATALLPADLPSRDEARAARPPESRRRDVLSPLLALGFAEPLPPDYYLG